MRIHCTRTAASCALAVACLAGAGNAQTPSSASGSVVVAKPTYTSIPMEITVNRPAAEVWKRIGKYCDVAEWLQIPAGCTITSGKDGELGAVRTVGAEVLVSKTELSYTYTQTPKDGQLYNLYHGTLEARPLTATTSKIVYTLFFDNSMLPDDAARAADRARRTERFTQALQNMKILAEGGKLAPASAGGGTTAGGAPPRQ
jgi:Polyketide cyclase / dehydrase and lipid transport